MGKMSDYILKAAEGYWDKYPDSFQLKIKYAIEHADSNLEDIYRSIDNINYILDEINDTRFPACFNTRIENVINVTDVDTIYLQAAYIGKIVEVQHEWNIAWGNKPVNGSLDVWTVAICGDIHSYENRDIIDDFYQGRSKLPEYNV
jgi:hypothetical protein